MLSLVSTTIWRRPRPRRLCRSVQPRVQLARAVDGVEDGWRLKKLTCGTHPSVSEGGGTTGVFWSIWEYNSLWSTAHGTNAVKYVENDTIHAEEEL